MTDKTATVPADEFMRAAANAALAAGKDDTLPSLTAVHFRPGHTPGTLMLEATNRYIASQEEIDLADLAAYDSDWYSEDIAKHLVAEHGWERPQHALPAVIAEHHTAKHAEGPAGHAHTVRPVPVTALDVLVNVTDLGKLVKTLKLVIDPGTRHSLPADRPHVVIASADDGRVAFTLINNLGPDTTISPRLVEGEFPRIDSPMTDAARPAEELAARLAESEAAAQADGPSYRKPQPVPDVWERRYLFNQDYLAALTKVQPGHKGQPVEFNFAATGKPALVKIGERYRALVIPIRGA